MASASHDEDLQTNDPDMRPHESINNEQTSTITAIPPTNSEAALQSSLVTTIEQPHATASPTSLSSSSRTHSMFGQILHQSSRFLRNLFWSPSSLQSESSLPNPTLPSSTDPPEENDDSTQAANNNENTPDTAEPGGLAGISNEENTENANERVIFIPEISMNITLQRVAPSPDEDESSGPSDSDTADLVRHISAILDRHRSHSAPDVLQSPLAEGNSSERTVTGRDSLNTEEGVFFLEVSDDEDEEDASGESDVEQAVEANGLNFRTGRVRRAANASHVDSMSDLSQGSSFETSTSSISAASTSSRLSSISRYYRIITEAYAIIPSSHLPASTNPNDPRRSRPMTIYTSSNDVTVDSLDSVLTLLIRNIAQAAHSAGFNGHFHLQGQPPASREAVEELKRVRIPFSLKRREKRGKGLCTVCQDTLSDGTPRDVDGMEVDKTEGEFEYGLMMPCRHLFHNQCLRKWLDSSNTCPTCRFEIKTDNVEYNVGVSKRMQERETCMNEPETDEEDDILFAANLSKRTKRKRGQSSTEGVEGGEETEEESDADGEGRRKRARWDELDGIPIEPLI
ncbi:hypothetical protein HDV05_004820 [Chytridiales sp. JEL 0842]|nr:hypothetical protein HDV05_004820 [Chytridiales sp. JEL 0842]